MRSSIKILYTAPRTTKQDYVPYDTSRPAIQFDLIDLRNLAQTKPYKYLLTVIEQHSRYLWAAALKNKTPSNVAEAFKIILPELLKIAPDITTARSDDGNEFKDKIPTILKDHGLNYTRINKSVEGMTGLALVERVNRTILDRLIPMIHTNPKRDVLDMIKEVVLDYNDSVHSTTKCSPNDVIDEKCDPRTKRTDYEFGGVYEPGTFVLRLLEYDAFTKRRMRWYPSPYVVLSADDTDNSHIIGELLTGDMYHLALPRYKLKKITKKDADRLIDDLDDNMKVYHKERKDNTQRRIQRQVTQDIRGIGHEVQSVDEEGNVTYKPRLTPKTTKEGRRKQARRPVEEDFIGPY